MAAAYINFKHEVTYLHNTYPSQASQMPTETREEGLLAAAAPLGMWLQVGCSNGITGITNELEITSNNLRK